MKTLFITIALAAISLTAGAKPIHKSMHEPVAAAPRAKIHIDGYATVPGTPCRLHIVGDATFSIIPPDLTSFNGTVTYGAGCCCTGTMPVHYSNGKIIADGGDGAYEFNNSTEMQATVLNYIRSQQP